MKTNDTIYGVYATTAFLLLFCFSSFSQNKYTTTEIEPLYDVNFNKAERDSLYNGLQDMQKSLQALHQYKLENAIPMSLIFDPIPPGYQAETTQKSIDWGLPKDVVLP